MAKIDDIVDNHTSEMQVSKLISDILRTVRDDSQRDKPKEFVFKIRMTARKEDDFLLIENIQMEQEL